MPRETDRDLPTVGYFPSASDRVVIPARLRWRAGQQVRVLVVEPDQPPGIVAALVAHRDFPTLGFRLDLNRDGDLVGFSMRPLVQVTQGPITSFDVDAVGFPSDAEPITTRKVREVPIGALHLAAQAAARKAGRLLGVTAEANGWAPVFHHERRPGRRGRPDRFYAALAAEYVDRLDAGDKRPVATMAERRNLSASQVRNLLAEARVRGLLTHPGQGRARGSLTDDAIALLSNADDTDHTEDK